jgi:hypothetical protein
MSYVVLSLISSSFIKRDVEDVVEGEKGDDGLDRREKEALVDHLRKRYLADGHVGPKPRMQAPEKVSTF